MELSTQIIRTLLYYDIFNHPLTERELFSLLPQNSLSKKAFSEKVQQLIELGVIDAQAGFISIPSNASTNAKLRREREKRAKRRMRIARLMSQVMKRFPFVRAVFLSGDLSKGVANPGSDIDYVIVTEPGRLWICRTLLILFKKIFLLNRKRFFCVNLFFDSQHLALDERNYYTATEIAHLKPLVNQKLYLEYMNANNWIHSFFPNYQLFELCGMEGSGRTSIVQKVFEAPFHGRWADRLDRYLMDAMKRIWTKRYPEYDQPTRDKIFHSSAYESRAFVGNFSVKILGMYADKLRQHGIA